MRKYLVFVVVCLLIGAQPTIAQGLLKKIKEKAKSTSEQRAESTGDKVANKAGDKVDAAVDSLLAGKLFKKKAKSKNDTDAAAELKALRDSLNALKEKEAAAKTDNKSSSGATGAGFGYKGKFDFIPGEKLLAVEDFSEDAIGDFPAKWGTNANGELVELNGHEGKWLLLGKSGIYYPEFIKDLPENFTLEFDMMATPDFSENQSGLMLIIPKESEESRTMFDFHFNKTPQVGLDIHPIAHESFSKIWAFHENEKQALENQLAGEFTSGQKLKVSVWRQKNRYRVYINENKVWDLPSAFVNGVKYTMLFATYSFGGDLLISNLRLAVGAPDTRNKLITDGKLVTNGILFDVNKSLIKDESYPVVKEIAAILKEYPTIRINIVGHTDSDGNADQNLALSKARAASVKQMLISEFGIDDSRLETDGKGSTEPIDTGSTSTAKAKNRRVEFIKL
mgnify:CR=1 FL=1